MKKKKKKNQNSGRLLLDLVKFSVVLVVLEDNKVVRTILPSVESDPKFWQEWDELKIDGLCMTAYSPSAKNPDIPKPYLGFLSKTPLWMFSLLKTKPHSKKALELKRVREEFKRRRNDELAKMKEDRETMENAIKAQKKMEEKQKRREMKKLKYEESGARVRRAQRKKLPQFLERGVDVKFTNHIFLEYDLCTFTWWYTSLWAPRGG